MRNEDEVFTDERPYDAEYEEFLAEKKAVRQKGEDYWNSFHKYDKFPAQGKEDFIDGFEAGWFQRAGKV